MSEQKHVAILTGATGGLGYAFLKEIIDEGYDEIWAIGRNEKRLNELTSEFGETVIPLPVNLTDAGEIAALGEVLKERKPQVDLLINNAGMAQMKYSSDLTREEIDSTVDLNCKAPVVLTNECLPYMRRGSKIINVCSAAAFQPTPYINLYASTKAFARSYSRALNAELKPYGITVTAVCPSWIDTDMLTRDFNGQKIKFYGMVSPERVAKKAIKDANKGKDMSVCSAFVKFQHLNVKLMPQKLTMKIWMKYTKKYM